MNSIDKIFSLKPADRCMVWSVGCRGSAPNFGTHDVQLCMSALHSCFALPTTILDTFVMDTLAARHFTLGGGHF